MIQQFISCARRLRSGIRYLAGWTLDAYGSDESGVSEVYVRPFPEPGGKWQNWSSGGGRFPVWSRDGRELPYKSPDAQPLRACHETSGSIACAWGRRSVFVACPERSGWQATENDGLPTSAAFKSTQLTHLFRNEHLHGQGRFLCAGQRSRMVEPANPARPNPIFFA